MDYSISLTYKSENYVAPFSGKELYLRNGLNGFTSNDIPGVETPAGSGNYIFQVLESGNYKLWNETDQYFIPSFSSSQEGKSIVVANDITGFQSQLNTKLDKAGGTMTGTIDMNSNTIDNIPVPTQPNQPVSKVYLESQLNTKLDKAGGTMTGDVNMNSNYIDGLPEPIDDFQPVRKVDLSDTLDQLLPTLVDLNTEQTITAKKIFSTVPNIMQNPTLSYHGTRKDYVDSSISSKVPYSLIEIRLKFKDGSCSLLTLANQSGQTITFSKIPMSTGEFKLYCNSPIFTLASNGTSYISLYHNLFFLSTPYSNNIFFRFQHLNANQINIYTYDSAGNLTDFSFDYLNLLIHIYPDYSN